MYQSMTASMDIPHFTYCDEVQMDRLKELRAEVKEMNTDVSISFMPFLIKVPLRPTSCAMFRLYLTWVNHQPPPPQSALRMHVVAGHILGASRISTFEQQYSGRDQAARAWRAQHWHRHGHTEWAHRAVCYSRPGPPPPRHAGTTGSPIRQSTSAMWFYQLAGGRDASPLSVTLHVFS